MKVTFGCEGLLKTTIVDLYIVHLFTTTHGTSLSPNQENNATVERKSWHKMEKAYSDLFAFLQTMIIVIFVTDVDRKRREQVFQFVQCFVKRHFRGEM